MKHFLLVLLLASIFSVSAQTHIQALPNGNIKYSVSYLQAQAYVEVFVKKNGTQIIAQNIVSSETFNSGSYVYSLETPASNYQTGDQLQTRFYSYVAGQAGVFKPGPTEATWSEMVTVGAPGTSCGNTYIKALSDGSLQFNVSYPATQAYVELFVKKNGQQVVATAIVSSEVSIGGVYHYSYTLSAANVAIGDRFMARFYSYAAGQPGVFTPGPGESVWSEEFLIGANCSRILYVSATGSDNNPGSIGAPFRTITKAIATASMEGASEIRISQGTYEEGNLTVLNGVSITGGYNSNFTLYNPALYPTVVDANQPSGVYVCGSKRIFRAENISARTVIKGMTMTRGRLCAYGGGIYIRNCNENLEIRENIITYNSSVGNGSSSGGNIHMESSNCKILYNTITYGFAGAGFGNDMFIANSNNGAYAEVAYNVFTYPSNVFGVYAANFHDNSYLYSYRAGAAPSENLYMATELKVSENTVEVMTEEEQIEVLVSDISGKVLLLSEEKMIDVSGLRQGLYLVKVKAGSEVLTGKFLQGE